MTTQPAEPAELSSDRPQGLVRLWAIYQAAQVHSLLPELIRLVLWRHRHAVAQGATINWSAQARWQAVELRALEVCLRDR